MTKNQETHCGFSNLAGQYVNMPIKSSRALFCFTVGNGKVWHILKEGRQIRYRRGRPDATHHETKGGFQPTL